MATGRSDYVEFGASSFYGSQTLRINWSETYDQSANTSDVTITSIQLKSNTYYGQSYHGNMIIKINGAAAITLVEENNTVWLNGDGQWGTVVDTNGATITGVVRGILHNDNGSKVTTISIEKNTKFSNPVFWEYSPGAFVFAAESKNAVLTNIPRQYTLSISTGTGSSIAVTRNGTPLTNGATITYGDSLVVAFYAFTGYAIATHTVNGSTFTSGGTHTVTGNVSVVSTATAVKSTISASNGTFGTALTINVTYYSSSYRHTIAYSCAGYTGNIVTNWIGTSYSWTPPLAMMNGIPSATSASCTLTITTYSGNTSLGSNSTTITLSVPTSVKPSPSLSVSDAMGYASTYGGYVQGQSKAAVTVTDGNQYSATTASRSTTANGSTYTAASFTTGALVSSGTNTISTTVRDSRGRTGSASTSINVLPYTAPSISSFGVHRTDSTGRADDNGEYFVVTYAVSISPLNNRNGSYLRYRYKTTTSGTWTQVDLTSTGYEQSGTTAPVPISTDNSYDVEFILSDHFATITRSTTLSTTPSVISFKSGGLGAAFGKAAETDNLLDVAWNTMVRGYLMVGTIRVLQAGVDLNDLTAATDAGLYTIASGVSNAPTPYAGLLNISNGINGTHQLVFNNGGVWVRSHTGWPLAWTAWTQIV